MINLYQETLECLRDNGKKEEDILWIGTAETLVLEGWRGMAELFGFEYDCSYGSTKINEGLMVVGDSWWLERHEYDGSEWWEYKEHPKKPCKPLPDDMDYKRSFVVRMQGW